VEEIAAAAGISRRTFFRYFPSRDDVLIATPVRAMLRSVDDFCAQPITQSIPDALLAISTIATVAPIDSELTELSHQVMARSPVAWRRALSQVRKEADAAFAEAVAYRLRRAGKDITHTSALGAALAALVVQAHMDWVREGSAGKFEDELKCKLTALSDL
jgi:AcrR family transcriptional regulator